MPNADDVPRRIAGHALTMEWSGEYGVESSSTGTCKCGAWEESASSQNEVRFEYRMHLRRVWETSVIPPEGWLPFGSLIDHDGPAECSDETGEDGLPLWERPLPPEVAGCPHD